MSTFGEKTRSLLSTFEENTHNLLVFYHHRGHLTMRDVNFRKGSTFEKKTHNLLVFDQGPRKVDVRLPGKGNSNSHGARPVHLIILMIMWTRTSRLSIKNSLSLGI